jgi:glycosyltransferase involved in cell wall biosynthesis
MKILYSLPHPSDRLDVERAGHVIRANALLGSLERLGHEVIRVEASGNVGGSDLAVNTYRGFIKRYIPRSVSLRLRDAGRLVYTRIFARRLVQAVEMHRPDLILETNIAFSSAGAIASTRTGVPLVLDDVALPLEEDTEVGYGIGLKAAAVKVFRKITRQASLVIAVSGTIRQFLLKEGVDDSKIAIIPNGIDADSFSGSADGRRHREILGISDETTLLVFVGSFQPFHRVDLLLDSFAELARQYDVYLLLVGDGSTAPAAREQAERLGISSRVHFAGRIPYIRVASYISVGDIAVLSGVLDFGNPMKLIEYMAMGKAVVAPDLSVITDMATNGENILVFKDGSMESLTETLAQMVANPDLRDRLGAAALAYARSQTWDARAVDLLASLRRIGIANG